MNFFKQVHRSFIHSNCFSDALHTYFGLCGLSLMEEPGLNAIHAALNITQRAAHHLKKLHSQTIS